MRAVRLSLAMVGLAVCGLAQEAPSFLLEAGDYRWVPLNIHQTPVSVEVSYRVLNGEQTVHVELVPEAAFRPMQRGLPHEALSATADGVVGAMRRVIDSPGAYRVVITNKNGAKPALVSWRVSTVMNPAPVATQLSPKRQFATIAISFLLFFAMVGYSGWKLRKSAQS